MTVIAATPSLGHRVATTVRVHASNPWSMFYTPAIITLGVFALNYAIWRSVLFAAGDRGVDPDAFDYNGGVTWVMFYLVVVAVQAMNQTFSFTVGLGSTRRDYYAGTSLIFCVLAATFGVGIALMAGLERLTDGWGVNGRFFAPAFLQTLPLWQIAAIFTLALLLLMFIGAAGGATFVRWGPTGLIAFFGALAVLAIALNFGFIVLGWWQPFADFITDRSAMEIAALTLPITAVCAALGYVLLRRATPKG